jgi:hypothetical protein
MSGDRGSQEIQCPFLDIYLQTINNRSREKVRTRKRRKDPKKQQIK